MFYNLEKLLSNLQSSLDLLEKVMQDYGEELPTNFSKSSIPVWQKIQDELIE